MFLRLIAVIFCICIFTIGANSQEEIDLGNPFLVPDENGDSLSSPATDSLGESNGSQTYKEDFSARALIQATNTTTLSAQIDGVVTSTPKKEGSRFKKGDTLLKFDCREYEVNKQRARASLLHATENRKNKEELARLKSAGTLEVALAKAEEAISKSDFALASIPVNFCEIKAPYNGKITQIQAKLYQFVPRGSPIIEILDDSSFAVKLIIPSSWLSWLKIKDQIQVNLDETGKTHKAKINSIGSKIDPVSQTVAVNAIFIEKPAFILPGMSGTGYFSPPDGR